MDIGARSDHRETAGDVAGDHAMNVTRHEPPDRLEEVIGFYRNGIGLPELGRFEGHDGYDGVFLGLPGTDAHLEFTSGGNHSGPAPHPETLLVLYVGDDEAVER